MTYREFLIVKILQHCNGEYEIDDLVRRSLNELEYMDALFYEED